MRITFVTGNKGKLHEAQLALVPLGHDVVAADLHPVEIQGETLDEISRAKCEVLFGRLDPPFFVDDGGLFVHALNEFPGVFSAHALKKIGVPGILKLMDGVADRRAHFACVVSYYDGEKIHTFAGRCEGTLATAPRSTGHGFGFDPIFVPHAGVRGVRPPELPEDLEGLTLGELSAEIKNRISHRGKALAQLARYLS